MFFSHKYKCFLVSILLSFLEPDGWCSSVPCVPEDITLKITSFADVESSSQQMENCSLNFMFLTLWLVELLWYLLSFFWKKKMQLCFLHPSKYKFEHPRFCFERLEYLGQKIQVGLLHSAWNFRMSERSCHFSKQHCWYMIRCPNTYGKYIHYT